MYASQTVAPFEFRAAEHAAAGAEVWHPCPRLSHHTEVGTAENYLMFVREDRQQLGLNVIFLLRQNRMILATAGVTRTEAQ